MNKTFSNNRKLYPSFLEFRHTENRRPPRSAPPRWRPACKAPPSTLTRTSFARTGAGRHAPAHAGLRRDADAIPGLAGRARRGARRAGAAQLPGHRQQPSGRGAARRRRPAARVAVVSPDIAAADLLALAEAGVAGIRLNLIGLPLPALDQPAWQELLAHVNTLGWHVEVHLQASRLPAIMPALLAPAAAWSSTASAARTRPWASPTPASPICCARPTAARSGSSWRRPIATGRRRTVRGPAVKPPGCC